MGSGDSFSCICRDGWEGRTCTHSEPLGVGGTHSSLPQLPGPVPPRTCLTDLPLALGHQSPVEPQDLPCHLQHPPSPAAQPPPVFCPLSVSRQPLALWPGRPARAPHPPRPVPSRTGSPPRAALAPQPPAWSWWAGWGARYPPALHAWGAPGSARMGARRVDAVPTVLFFPQTQIPTTAIPCLGEWQPLRRAGRGAQPVLGPLTPTLSPAATTAVSAWTASTGSAASVRRASQALTAASVRGRGAPGGQCCGTPAFGTAPTSP